MLRKYHQAAEIVFDKAGTDPGMTPVLNFLYFHTLELLLKSYLRAHGRRVREGHKISEIYRQAQQLGLRLQHDPLGLHNIVSLLDSGNKDNGFRYFTLKSGSEPDLNWTRRIVGELVQVVTPFVESASDRSAVNKPVKLVLKFSEPASRKP